MKSYNLWWCFANMLVLWLLRSLWADYDDDMQHKSVWYEGKKSENFLIRSLYQKKPRLNFSWKGKKTRFWFLPRPITSTLWTILKTDEKLYFDSDISHKLLLNNCAYVFGLINLFLMNVLTEQLARSLAEHVMQLDKNLFDSKSICNLLGEVMPNEAETWTFGIVFSRTFDLTGRHTPLILWDEIKNDLLIF